jgi:O-antigen/teichoic acid export membrane protein
VPNTAKVLRGSASNVTRLFVTVFLGLLLPRILIGTLSRDEYSAWVLILQLSSYVALLDLGLQTVIAKFMAEHHARQDSEASARLLSTSVSVLALTTLVGFGLVAVLAWNVPLLFAQMPNNLYSEVRVGLVAVGLSSALALPFGPFLSSFIGLQSYLAPTILSVGSKTMTVFVVLMLTVAHASLSTLAIGYASVTLATCIAQYFTWQKFLKPSIAFRPFRLYRSTASILFRSGGVIALWSVGTVIVSGLDTVVVGHYDFANTGYFALAMSATTFIILFANDLVSPIMPALSAMHVSSGPEQVAAVVLRISRLYSMVVIAVSLLAAGLAFPILTLWVGPVFAAHAARFLQLLLVANCIRQIGYTYSLALIATNRQAVGLPASIGEAAVNLGSSLALVLSLGAPGVAIGTAIGAVVSVVGHVVISIPLARGAIPLRQSNFILNGVLRPLGCFLPLIAAVMVYAMQSPTAWNVFVIAAAAALSLTLAWSFGLSRADRGAVAVLGQKLRDAGPNSQ